jgi:hypothetical protein
MVRVVSPRSTVAAYAWDVAGGGFPLQPVQAELLAMGFNPTPRLRLASFYLSCAHTRSLSECERAHRNCRQGRASFFGIARIRPASWLASRGPWNATCGCYCIGRVPSRLGPSQNVVAVV